MIVDIKGVGKAQFPDGMSKDSIREFLRKKYAQQAIQGQSDALQPAPQTIEPYEPTLAEKIGQGAADVLQKTGIVSDNYGAQRIGRNLTSLGEFLPGVGDATAGDEFGRAVAKDDKFGMAMAGLGVIPIAGDTLKQTLRKAKSVNLPAGKLGSDQFKLIKQIDPKAKTKANADGSVNVSYLEEYEPKQIKGPLHEFDPDALELSESTFKNTAKYKGDKTKPISVTKQDGDYVILDGHHRAKLAKEEGRDVRAIVIPIEDVAEMKTQNIHQGDMLKEWVATGKHKQATQSLPMDEASRIKGYRGLSAANKKIDPNITWFSVDEKLAKGYSDKNKAFSADLNIKKPFDAGDDKNTITPRKLANKALQQIGSGNIDKKTAMLIREDFLSNYPDPDKSVDVLDFWSSDDGKDTVANMLEDLGFDAIRLKEEGVETYGVIRMNNSD